MALDRRLRWRCRRGTREMDLILGRFLESVGGDLDDAERQDLERLLDESDREILDWIARRSAPADAALAVLVDRIRSASSAPRDRWFPRAT